LITTLGRKNPLLVVVVLFAVALCGGLLLGPWRMGCITV
jgi:hypothetical protein